MTRTGFVLVCLLCSTTMWAQSPTPTGTAPAPNPTEPPPGALSASMDLDGGQDSTTSLHRRPAASEATGSEAAVETPLHPERLTGAEAPPPGTVWVPTGNQWSARETNSCFWCAKPMTFRRALLDKKGIGMWGTALAMTVADIEVLASRQCYKAGTCREGNPILGQTRTQQYGVRLPLLAGAWIGTAWLRKGDHRLHVGGMKYWWILPLAYQVSASAGVISNLTHVH